VTGKVKNAKFPSLIWRDFMQNEPEMNQSRGIYLLPNLFTTAALFAGFYSIVAAMKGLYDIAAIAVFVSMVADTLDGRVARMTNTQTAFGAQYDSLSDMVAFGVAPALLLYSWSLSTLGKMGWLAAFWYTAATSLRLARFNTQSHDEDKSYFQGLPCPAAAGLVASWAWLCSTYEIDGFMVIVPTTVLAVLAGVFMVSTIRYYSFKQVDAKGRVPFFTATLMVVLLMGVAIAPPQVFFVTLFIYMFSGPLLTLWQVRKIRKEKKKNKMK
jgi:CDP-diacylglycerol--serine O-phosphatidyltransferase